MLALFAWPGSCVRTLRAFSEGARAQGHGGVRPTAATQSLSSRRKSVQSNLAVLCNRGVSPAPGGKIVGEARARFSCIV